MKPLVTTTHLRVFSNSTNAGEVINETNKESTKINDKNNNNITIDNLSDEYSTDLSSDESSDLFTDSEFESLELKDMQWKAHVADYRHYHKRKGTLLSQTSFISNDSNASIITNNNKSKHNELNKKAISLFGLNYDDSDNITQAVFNSQNSNNNLIPIVKAKKNFKINLTNNSSGSNNSIASGVSSPGIPQLNRYNSKLSLPDLKIKLPNENKNNCDLDTLQKNSSYTNIPSTSNGIKSVTQPFEISNDNKNNKSIVISEGNKNNQNNKNNKTLASKFGLSFLDRRSSTLRSDDSSFRWNFTFRNYSTHTPFDHAIMEENRSTFSKLLHLFCNSDKFFLQPDGNYRLYWDMIVVILLIYTTLEIPFTIAFQIDMKLSQWYGILAFTTDLLLCFDILLNLRTGYIFSSGLSGEDIKLLNDNTNNIIDKTNDEDDSDRGFPNVDKTKAEYIIIYNQKLIFYKYLRSWLLIDLASSFPLEFVVNSNYVGYLQFLRIIRLVRMVKLIRFFKTMKKVQNILKLLKSSRSILLAQFIKIVFYMLITAHFVACLWHLIGRIGNGRTWLDTTYIEYTPEDTMRRLPAQNTTGSYNNSIITTVTKTYKDMSLGDRYITSLYWAIVTLFTTGYGDIVPTNRNERLVASAAILIGTCYSMYLVGALSMILTQGFHEKLQQAMVKKEKESKKRKEEKRKKIQEYRQKQKEEREKQLREWKRKKKLKKKKQKAKKKRKHEERLKKKKQAQQQQQANENLPGESGKPKKQNDNGLTIQKHNSLVDISNVLANMTKQSSTSIKYRSDDEEDASENENDSSNASKLHKKLKSLKFRHNRGFSLNFWNRNGKSPSPGKNNMVKAKSLKSMTSKSNSNSPILKFKPSKSLSEFEIRRNKNIKSHSLFPNKTLKMNRSKTLDCGDNIENEDDNDDDNPFINEQKYKRNNISSPVIKLKLLQRRSQSQKNNAIKNDLGKQSNDCDNEQETNLHCSHNRGSSTTSNETMVERLSLSHSRSSSQSLLHLNNNKNLNDLIVPDLLRKTSGSHNSAPNIIVSHHPVIPKRKINKINSVHEYNVERSDDIIISNRHSFSNNKLKANIDNRNRSISENSDFNTKANIRLRFKRKSTPINLKIKTKNLNKDEQNSDNENKKSRQIIHDDTPMIKNGNPLLQKSTINDHVSKLQSLGEDDEDITPSTKIDINTPTDVPVLKKSKPKLLKDLKVVTPHLRRGSTNVFTQPNGELVVLTPTPDEQPSEDLIADIEDLNDNDISNDGSSTNDSIIDSLLAPSVNDLSNKANKRSKLSKKRNKKLNVLLRQKRNRNITSDETITRNNENETKDGENDIIDNESIQSDSNNMILSRDINSSISRSSTFRKDVLNLKSLIDSGNDTIFDDESIDNKYINETTRNEEEEEEDYDDSASTPLISSPNSVYKDKIVSNTFPFGIKKRSSRNLLLTQTNKSNVQNNSNENSNKTDNNQMNKNNKQIIKTDIENEPLLFPDEEGSDSVIIDLD